MYVVTLSVLIQQNPRNQNCRDKNIQIKQCKYTGYHYYKLIAHRHSEQWTWWDTCQLSTRKLRVWVVAFLSRHSAAPPGVDISGVLPCEEMPQRPMGLRYSLWSWIFEDLNGWILESDSIFWLVFCPGLISLMDVLSAQLSLNMLVSTME